MSKTKVLFIHHSSGWGGAPINMINIIKELDKTKYEAHVLLLKDSVVKERLSELNIPYTICDASFYKKWYRYFTHSDAKVFRWNRFISMPKMFISWFLSKYFYASKVLKKHTFDIVHLNSSVLSDWLYPASKLGKTVYHIQEPISKGILGFRYQLIRSEVSKYADRVIAISKDNARRIDLPEKTEIVYNFTDIPETVHNNSSDKRVLFVGGAAEIKGIHVLIDALPLLNKSTKVVIAGHFPNIKPLGKLKSITYQVLKPRSFKLRRHLELVSKFNNVELIGTVMNINDAMRKTRLLISPFTVPHFSRPVIEAFAHSKPVIVSDVKGMNEIVDDKLNGLIVKNKDAKALANAINSLLNDQALAESMGKNGRLKAIELYSAKHNIKKIESVYTELVSCKNDDE